MQSKYIRIIQVYDSHFVAHMLSLASTQIENDGDEQARTSDTDALDAPTCASVSEWYLRGSLSDDGTADGSTMSSETSLDRKRRFRKRRKASLTAADDQEE